jgi:hypothetical protein
MRAKSKDRTSKRKRADRTNALVEAAISGLRALHGDIRFVNESGEPVDIFWLNYSGQREPFKTLNAGEAYLQGSYFTHAWVVASKDGVCRYLTVVSQGNNEFIIRKW